MTESAETIAPAKRKINSYRQRRKTADQCFWETVNKDGPVQPHTPHLGPCWQWTASANKDGYGQFNTRPKMKKSHRVSWELCNGPIPEGIQALHKCDNRRCVNPNHIFLGTNADNNADMESKGRGNQPKGERQHSAKLTTEKVSEIRKIYSAGGTTQAAIGRMFGVTKENVFRIVTMQTWKHVH